MCRGPYSTFNVQYPNYTVIISILHEETEAPNSSIAFQSHMVELAFDQSLLALTVLFLIIT